MNRFFLMLHIELFFYMAYCHLSTCRYFIILLLEQFQKLDAEFFGGATDTSDNDAEHTCQHVYKLDDQIGMTCQLCNFVCTEIRYIAPPMVTSTRTSKDDCSMLQSHSLNLFPYFNTLVFLSCSYKMRDCFHPRKN